MPLHAICVHVRALVCVCACVCVCSVRILKCNESAFISTLGSHEMGHHKLLIIMIMIIFK